MVQILDKQGLQHYANKMCNADNRKVGSKSLPTALNDIDTAIDGFKTLFESEYGTPVNMEIENNQNIFTIGTGININKKDDVENSFTDVELSGNSLVNCLITDKLYKDSNYLEFENSPVITEGNITLKSRELNHVRFCPKIECGVIKPNTKYTLIFNVTSNNLTGRTNLTHTNTYTLISAFPFTNTIQPKQTGIFKYVLTSKEDIGSCNTLLRTIIWNDCSTEGETITFSLMILEGDWTNKPIPQYFEGMKSVGQDDVNGHKIEILSNNSNLISEAQKEWANKDNPRSEFVRTIDLSPIIDKYGLIEYTLTFDIKATKEGQCRVYAQNGSDSKYNIGYNDINVTTDYVRHKIKFTPTLTNPKIAMTTLAFYSTYGSGVFTTIKNIKLQIGGTSSDFVPHKFNKKEISLNEPLRGLPNGIRDTIEKINGEWKIVRRCSEIILNGSENWGRSSLSSEGYNIYFLNQTDVKAGSSSLCDILITTNEQNYPTTANSICFIGDKSLRINNGNKTETLEEFKQWLSQNPTKVVYELATPIIEDISPVTLQCWKNGTISIDEVLPVETTHTVALNKSAQIQKNIEELTILRNRVKALEEQYDKTALNQAYEVELLRLDMQLDNII